MWSVYLQDQERIGRDAGRVVDGGDEAAELRRRSEVAEIVDNRGSIGLDEEDAVGIAVDLNTAVVVAAEAAGHRVEGDEGLAEGGLHDGGVEEVGGAGGAVEVDAWGVHAGDHQVKARVPKYPTWRLLRRPHHRRSLHVDAHHLLHLSPVLWVPPTTNVQTTQPIQSPSIRTRYIYSTKCNGKYTYIYIYLYITSPGSLNVYWISLFLFGK